MKSIFAVAAAALAVTALVTTGCSSADESDPSNGANEPTDSSSDELRASVLAATFTITGKTDDTIFNTLTMKGDHTFSGQGGCRQDGPGIHCHAITAIHGTWKTVTSGPQLGAPAGAAQLQFTDSFGQKTTYFYSLTNDQLALSVIHNGKKSLFDRAINTLPKLRSYSICADKYGNTLGQCPEDLPCEYDGPDGNVQRCLPPI